MNYVIFLKRSLLLVLANLAERCISQQLGGRRQSGRSDRRILGVCFGQT